VAIARALLADPKILLLDEGKALRLLARMLACLFVVPRCLRVYSAACVDDRP
jgi:ABC-type branched-subunit amino acid transport system ATPase component